MKKYKLTEEEKDIANRFCNYSIPFIFKSGEYNGYMQYFELIDIEVCYALLKGERIDGKVYRLIEFGVDIDKEKLDDYALEYYDLYLQVEGLVKKYYRYFFILNDISLEQRDDDRFMIKKRNPLSVLVNKDAVFGLVVVILNIAVATFAVLNIINWVSDDNLIWLFGFSKGLWLLALICLLLNIRKLFNRFYAKTAPSAVKSSVGLFSSAEYLLPKDKAYEKLRYIAIACLIISLIIDLILFLIKQQI